MTIEKLYAGETLTQPETQSLFHNIMDGQYNDVILASILIAIKMRGFTADEISGAASGILGHAKPFPRPNYKFGDIVGTGGDPYNTFNVSSTSAIVAAACGAKVCKHGNRKVTSQSGAADVLSTLGIDLDAPPETSRQLLDNAGVCFLMAPNYHPAVRHAMPVRQELKTRTIFNVLGPLINPARPDYIVNGVYENELLPIIADAHQKMDMQNAAIVHGSGLDEVALHGTTNIIEIQNGIIQDTITLSPTDFGLPEQSIDDIAGSTPDANAVITTNVANGTATDAQQNIVAANVAVYLRTAGIETDLKRGVDMAKNAMHNGSATNALSGITLNGITGA